MAAQVRPAQRFFASASKVLNYSFVRGFSALCAEKPRTEKQGSLETIMPTRPQPARPTRAMLGALTLVFSLLLGGCTLSVPMPFGAAASTAEPAAELAAPEQPVALSGTLRYTNDLGYSYDNRTAVALVDMHGFVARDQGWRIPGDTLMFGKLRLDTSNQTGSYHLYLPARPPGTFNDVDHDGADEQGVKIYTVSFWEDPFGGGDRRARGWPTRLASTIADPEQGDEITGGRLVVWAPAGGEQFPSDFGDDERLFSGDDPLMQLPAGYSVVDLGQRPFAIDRSATPALKLYEDAGYAVKDFSNLSYTKALKRVFEELRRDYAFNGVEGKQPDWDALYERLLPRVTQAEQAGDAQAFYLAMRELTLAFHDGHVSLDGGDRDDALFGQTSAGGYGLAMRQADDGRFLAVFVQPGGPAERAGIRAGAELLSFGGQPIAQALAGVQPLNAPFSTELALREAQGRYLLRAQVGASATIGYANPGQPPASATLAAADERDSLRASSLKRDADPTALPVEYRILDSGLGYVRVSSNSDDFDLIDELFWRALSSFEYHEVKGVIVDLRQNDGGSLVGFAGYLTDQPIELARLAYYERGAGAFEPEGPPETIEPLTDPFTFGRLAVLVGQGCFSACELEAYGLSRLPGALVVGDAPTAGVVAEVSEGQYELPEDLWLQAPTGRYLTPDGQLFLEGQGVTPTLRVPLEASTLLDPGDPVLEAAEQALLK